MYKVSQKNWPFFKFKKNQLENIDLNFDQTVSMLF